MKCDGSDWSGSDVIGVAQMREGKVTLVSEGKLINDGKHSDMINNWRPSMKRCPNEG